MNEQSIPAEVVKPGRNIQRVNLLDAGGEFLRQVVYPGTEFEARCWGALQITKHVDEDGTPNVTYSVLRAVLAGDVPNTREGLLDHIATHAECEGDDSDFTGLTDFQLAEWVFLAHDWAKRMK